MRFYILDLGGVPPHDAAQMLRKIPLTFAGNMDPLLFYYLSLKKFLKTKCTLQWIATLIHSSPLVSTFTFLPNKRTFGPNREIPMSS